MERRSASRPVQPLPLGARPADPGSTVVVSSVPRGSQSSAPNWRNCVSRATRTGQQNLRLSALRFVLLTLPAITGHTSRWPPGPAVRSNATTSFTEAAHRCLSAVGELPEPMVRCPDRDTHCYKDHRHRVIIMRCPSRPILGHRLSPSRSCICHRPGGRSCGKEVNKVGHQASKFACGGLNWQL